MISVRRVAVGALALLLPLSTALPSFADDDVVAVETVTEAPVDPVADVPEPEILPDESPEPAPADTVTELPEPGEVESTNGAQTPIVASPAAVSGTVDNGDGTFTLTYGDGATITYNSEVVAGQPIVLSGTGWVIKPGQENNPAFLEGDEGSIIGVKFMPDSGGTVIRDPKPTNPWNGATDYASPDVWEIIQAAGTGSWWNGKTYGSWDVEIPWPTTQNGAVNAPDLKPGDTFSLQFLGGTLYGNTVCTGGGTCLEERPDISRSINLQFTIVAGGGTTDPDPGQNPDPVDPVPGDLTVAQQPADALVGNGAKASFVAAITGGTEPVTVQWQRSTNASATTVPPDNRFVNIPSNAVVDGSDVLPTLTVIAGQSSNAANRWYRAIFTDADGKSVTTDAVKLNIVPAPTVVAHPEGQTISAGGTAHFTASADSALAMTIQWQSTATALPNGEPNDATWSNVSGATGGNLDVLGTDPAAQHGVFYRAAFTNASGTTYSYPAELRFVERLDSDAHVRVTGESYGPTGVVPNSFSVEAPNAVVKGEPIVIEGSGYLHPDGKQGSVANFMIDASYSGDPNTLYSTREIINPATGKVFTDPRSHGVVQADSAGNWRIEIPWPDETNTTQSADFFAAHWAPGSHHMVRILTGSLLDGDYQQGITVRFTVVDAPTSAVDAPVTITAQPIDQAVEAGGRAEFSVTAVGSPVPTVQWQQSLDGGATWANVRGATSNRFAVDGVTQAQSGYQFRAVLTNSASPQGESTHAATLTVTPRANVREYCGTSYGPGASNTGVPFCFRGPEKVVAGEPIVIEGEGGFLASDDATGSVVNFFLDAEFSGDPNTVYTKKLATNPVTGEPVTDRRTHAAVQADAMGSWRIEIPFPTVDSVSPSNDGTANYSQVALDAKFAPGTSHSVRLLTGSLLANPVDRQRGASVYFTVVESLDDDVAVSEPLYEHQSVTTGDGATAWVSQQVNSGQNIALTGLDWRTKDQLAGSTVIVRLQDQAGTYYRHSGESGDGYPDPRDPTVWQIIHANRTGDINAQIDMPDGVSGGGYLAVELTTIDDGTVLGDVARHWVSQPVVIDRVPYVAGPAEGATCTAAPGAATYEIAPGMAVPAANVGGTIRVTGKNWCNLVGGGSLIAFKINDGAFSRLPSDTAPMFDANIGEEVGACPAGACVSNKTIWYTVEADEKGSFDVEIPLPTRTNSAPGFGEGAYTFRIMTRTLSADPYYQGSRPDPSRTMKSPEFTVVAEGVSLDTVKPGKPQAAPDPLHVTDELKESVRGGVSVNQQESQWVITVPGANPGDWVYVNLYQGNTPRFPWNNEWFEVDAYHQIRVPLAGATLAVGTNKLSVQNRHGAPLGWTYVTVESAPNTVQDAGSGSDTPVSVANSSRATILFAPTVMMTQVAKPEETPEPPVAYYADLTDENVGEVTGIEEEGILTVTVPGVEGGHWVYLYLYTEAGDVIPIDWVQVGSDHTFSVEIGALPDGMHKLAIVGEDGSLIGWVSANGPQPLAADAEAQEMRAAPGDGTSAGGAAGNPTSTGEDFTWTLVLIGGAFLVLAGSAAAVIMLRTPLPTRRGQTNG